MKELFGNMSIIYTYPTVYFKCKYLPHSVSSGEGLLPDEGGLSPTERYKKECPELFTQWCLSPAKKYKLYKSSINKSLHFAQRHQR